MKKNTFVRLLTGLAVAIGGFVFFNYITITDGGISFHVKYSIPTGEQIANFVSTNGGVVLGFMAFLTIIVTAVYVLRR